MVSKIVIVCLAVLLLVCLSDAKKGGKGKGGGKGNALKRCLGVDLEFSDDVKNAFKTCRKNRNKNEGATEASEAEEAGEEEEGEGKGKGKWNGRRRPCFLDCVYRESGWITSEGKLDEEKIDASIKKVYPEAAQAGLLADEKECRKEVTEKLTTENNCKTFKNYGTCHWKAMKKNCKKDRKA